jgi:hypothetical protein
MRHPDRTLKSYNRVGMASGPPQFVNAVGRTPLPRTDLATVVAFLCGCLLGVPAFPQTVATGAVSGQVESSDGLGVPGVAVSAESENLQGRRTAVTSPDGHYILPFLPPGDYTISFELTGFQTTKERVRVAVAQAVTLPVSLNVAPVMQAITVDARAPGDFSQNLPLISSYKQGDLVEHLPLDRTLIGTALLGPGVQSTGPGGNLVISGAVSYESLFLVNGVVVNDNQTGQPNPLFIEDAVQETATTTAAIPAEYGRFSGGVVNAITKSGGNRFSGSFRTTLSNDAWTALTPFPGDSRVDNRIPAYEATAGGRIVTDKLWFFGAGRHADSKNAAATSLTRIPYVFKNDENRYEGKLTYSLTSSHIFKASITKIDLAQYNRASGTFLDLASLSDRTNPQRLLSANYAGVLGPSIFVETQWSRRTYALVGSGAKFTDPLNGTLLFDREASNARYHAPSSCGVCTSEHRDNYDAVAKATYFLSTERTGSHDLVAGGDLFNDRRYDNQFPSASNYSIYGTSVILSGNSIYPVFKSDGTTFIRWTPIFTPTQGTNFRTYSAFGNDSWHVNNRLSVNLGLRYDKNGGNDSVGNSVIKDRAWSPRLGLSWDPRGDGIWTLNMSAAKYVAGILVTVADSSSPGGRAATFDYTYQGQAINADPSSSALVSQNAGIQTVFDWFNANGGTRRATRGTPSVPGLTTVIGNTLGSPDVVEWTAGVARRLGDRGAIRLDGIYRAYGNFYSDRVDLGTGRVTNSIGQVFDLDVIDNSSDLARKYRGIRIQASYRVSDRLGLGLNYALSETSGNYDGETFPSGGPVNGGTQSYPEYTQASWNRPLGDLSIDQRHRARAWATYLAPIPSELGSLNLGLLQFLDSGTPYGAIGLVDTRSFVQNPGYANPPASENYFFTPRDAFRTDATAHTDVAVNYAHKLGVSKRTEVFFRGTVVNLFNQQGIANASAVDRSVATANNSSRLQPFNPFTAAPARGVNWDYGPNFGRPLTRLAYQTPRTYGFSVGVRF